MSVIPTEPLGGGRPASPADQAVARHLADAVTEAGAIALRMFQSGLKSWTKDNNSPVTEADLAVDLFLRERLTGFDPGYGWLSEETADTTDRLSARRVWVVDPIDGTRGYMNGKPDWTVSAALVEDGRPLAAALFAPVTAELFIAMRGAGATRNGARLCVVSRDGLAGAAVAGPADALDALSRVADIRRMPRGSSLALRIARVATGEINVALSRAESHDWDLAAADLIVSEAAGRLTTLDGADLRYNAPVPRHAPLVCAGAALHPAALAAARAAACPPLPIVTDPDQP